MNRRELLGTSIASLFTSPWIEIQGKTMKEKTTSIYNFLEPYQLFTKEILKDGYASEYPLSFIYPEISKIYSLSNEGKLYTIEGWLDYVHVITYEIGASVDFAEEYYKYLEYAPLILKQSLINKINSDSLLLLEYCAKRKLDYTKYKEKTEEMIVDDFVKQNKNIKIAKYIKNDKKYLIGIEKHEDILMMPIRIEPSINVDPTLKNRKGFWAHMELGLVALESIGTVVILNKEPHELNSAEEAMLPYKHILDKQ